MKSTPPIIDFPLAPPGTMGPPAEYGRLRARCPVARVDIDPKATAWYVTRYADVRSLIADPRLVRPTINDWPDQSDLGDQGPGLTTMMELEGPEHTALRRALTDAFSVRTVRRRYLPHLRQLADGLLDSLAAGRIPGAAGKSHRITRKLLGLGNVECCGAANHVRDGKPPGDLLSRRQRAAGLHP